MVRSTPVIRILIGLLAVASLSACSKTEDELRGEAATQLIMQKNTEIAALKAEIEVLRGKIDQSGKQGVPSKANTQTSATATTRQEKVAVTSQPMCFKDYCPCGEEQTGMERMLCDRLEAGLPVQTEMMVNARAMKDVRRQIATGDY